MTRFLNLIRQAVLVNGMNRSITTFGIVKDQYSSYLRTGTMNFHSKVGISSSIPLYVPGLLRKVDIEKPVILFEGDEDRYTSYHQNERSDSEEHSTNRGESHTTHNYDDGSGRYDPWPVGGNDKWTSNDD